MATIKQTKNTVIPSWKVSWFEDADSMSRSKAIQDHALALKFKALVEEAGESMPAIKDLAEHGLIQYADWLHPKVLLEIQKQLHVADSDPEAIPTLRRTIDAILSSSRAERAVLAAEDSDSN